MIRWIIVRSQPPNKVAFDVNTIAGKIRCSFEEKLNERPWMLASFSFRGNAASNFIKSSKRSRAFFCLALSLKTANIRSPLMKSVLRLEKTRKRERSNDFELIDRADCTQWNWIFQSCMHTWVCIQFEILCNLLQDGSRREGKIERSNIEHSCNDLSTLPLYSIWLTNIINNSYREKQSRGTSFNTWQQSDNRLCISITWLNNYPRIKITVDILEYLSKNPLSCRSRNKRAKKKGKPYLSFVSSKLSGRV